jgi:hypothetical protein
LIDYYEHIVLPPRPQAAESAAAHSAPTPDARGTGEADDPSSEDTRRRSATRAAGVIGAPLLLAALQLVVGYEWLVSGVDTLLDGTFPDRLGTLIASLAMGGRLPDFFAQFLGQVVLPNSYAFGWAVELGETLTGAGLFAGALLTLIGPALRERLTAAAARRALSVVGALTIVAALASLAMAGNYYLLDGVPTPWFQPGFAFGGAIDASLLLALFSLVILLGRALSRWPRRGRLIRAA